MIKLNQVTKAYENKSIFKDFTLEIPKNKITCILGESGVGKTTLLNMIAGLTEYEGSILYEGKISYIFQNPRLLSNLTVKENLKFVQPLISDEEILDILDYLQMKDKVDRYPKTLSGGEAQRVSIARAFLVDAPIMLMDEPFSSLDLSIKFKLIHSFIELWQKKKRTVIFVTHDVDEALMLANDILILRQGNISKRFSLEDDYPREISDNLNLRTEIIKFITEK